MSTDTDQSVVHDSIAAALRFATDEFNVPTPMIAEALGKSLSVKSLSLEQKVSILDELLVSEFCTTELVKGLIQNAPAELAGPPAAWLLNRLRIYQSLLISMDIDLEK